ncbi:IS110 family transposase [Achromobacter sp. Bel]|uniref:IS110 family transposase n=1 Tax=Achromobacter sp. Bel TaxID=2727415 RepID=UPI00145D93DE|nr:IS110 family transposase [Achromobacter sp. Bel]NMK46051.1 IS110 family transposase [Achromobacter sp. Bel]
MSTVTLIGIDLGKHSFHLHGQDATGRMVFRKKCSRPQLFTLLGTTPSSTVVMEACAGVHWMARRIQALGQQAKLISPQLVRLFVQGNKNDFADAQAICEAASRPSMRFVSARNEIQQTVSALHRIRESLTRERTGVINQVHAFLLEFGISLPRGQAIIRRMPAVLAEHELARRHSNVVACALANKLARIACAILANGTNYRSKQAVSAI